MATSTNSQETCGFCPHCGSIFPQLKISLNVACYNCKNTFPPEVFGDMQIEYRIHFNTYNPKDKKKKDENKSIKDEDGPVIERKCPKCGCDKMSYATLQLRSADEGQTVFYTCIKCKYKETENS